MGKEKMWNGCLAIYRNEFYRLYEHKKGHIRNCFNISPCMYFLISHSCIEFCIALYVVVFYVISIVILTDTVLWYCNCHSLSVKDI